MKQAEMGRSLLEAFAQVPDRRAARGRRHPVPAMLAQATAAMRSGARSLYAIAHWGRTHPPESVSALGFTRPQTPAVATLHDPFTALDVAAFEPAVPAWAASAAGPARGARRKRAPQAPRAQDGKALRGIHGAELPGVRLVALDDVPAGLVLAPQGGQDPR